MQEEIEKIRHVILHCSNYQDGVRWCDFCNVKLAGYSIFRPGPEDTKHEDGCPVGFLVKKGLS